MSKNIFVNSILVSSRILASEVSVESMSSVHRKASVLSVLGEDQLMRGCCRHTEAPEAGPRLPVTRLLL